MRAAFGEVVVPPAVRREVVVTGRPGADAVAGAGWIRVEQPARTPVEHGLPPRLGAGEAETIALAIELGLTALLDDGEARRVAGDRGLAVLGSAGALEVAKRLGAIPAVLGVLDELRAAGLFLDDRAREHILRLAGEG